MRRTAVLYLKYLAVVSLGLAQPIYNNTEIFRREFDIGLIDVLSIVGFYQFVVAALVMLLRLLLRGKWAGAYDSLVYFAMVLALVRQAQLTYFQTDALSEPEKFALLGGVILVAALVIVFLKWVLDQILVFAGAVSPVLGAMFIYAMVANTIPLGRASLETHSTVPERPPVYFVILDGLSLQVMLDASGDIDNRTYPNLRAFAHDSVWFRQAVTHYHFTARAFPTMLSGKFRPPDWQDEGSLMRNIEASGDILPRIMKRDGYGVTIFSDVFGCAGMLYACPRYLSGSARGFLWRVFLTTLAKLGPDFVLDKALPWVRGTPLLHESDTFLDYAANPKPGNFYMLHSLLPHEPYVFNSDGSYHFSVHSIPGPGKDYSKVATNYKKQTMLLDREFGRFIAEMKRSGAYENAVIVVLADHGDCSSRTCPGRRFIEKVTVLEPELTRIPVFVRAPGFAPRIDDGDFQQIDVLPTVLEAARLPQAGAIDGRPSMAATGAVRKRPFFTSTDIPFDKAPDLGLPTRPVKVK